MGHSRSRQRRGLEVAEPVGQRRQVEDLADLIERTETGGDVRQQHLVLRLHVGADQRVRIEPDVLPVREQRRESRLQDDEPGA
jgi:hypothetical protein